MPKAKPDVRERCKLRFERRKRLGVSRDDIARPIGVRGITIYRWEFGKTTPTALYERRWDRELDKREQAQGVA